MRKASSWKAIPRAARPSSLARNLALSLALDLVAAAREATDARFDVLIACAFNFDAHSSELSKLGPLPILKAKMNPDLHMADDLKNTGKGNLFIVFGEPDIEIRHLDGGMIEVQNPVLFLLVIMPVFAAFLQADVRTNVFCYNLTYVTKYTISVI